jgi:hypothetical protein
MNIIVDDTKRAIVCYSSGKAPNIDQKYYLINYSQENTVEEAFDDIDNMAAHIVLQQTGTASQVPYCERPGLINLETITEDEKEDKKAEIKQQIDALLDLLKTLS